MKFGEVKSARAAGGILAHAIVVNGAKWKKGKRLAAADCKALLAAGVGQVVVAMPQPGDLLEDEAAAQVAAAFVGKNVRHGAPFTGRVNLFAQCDGLLRFNAAAANALNKISPRITAATLPPFARVCKGDLLATIKIIPFAVAGALCRRAAARRVAFEVLPFVRRRLALAQTLAPGAKAEALADKTRKVTSARLAGYGAQIVSEARTPHNAKALAAAIKKTMAQSAPQVLLVAGAQAVSDEKDIVPAAVVAAGGRVLRVGMPVDPGNLLLLAQIGQTPVVGLPGCAKSPKANGLDWALNRLLAGLPLASAHIAEWGVGGLLAEAPERPQPRQAPAATAAGAFGAVLLAAGNARRMRGENKLLKQWQGKPLVAHAASAVAAALAQKTICHAVAVTGRDGKAVAAALPPQLARAHNPRYARGMAGSIQRGIAALPPQCEAALVVLADMPRVSAGDIAAVVAAARANPAAAIVVAQHQGKRGNPVLLRRRLFAALAQLEGDSGARALFDGANTTTAECGAGVLFDVDTPQAFAGEGGEGRA